MNAREKEEYLREYALLKAQGKPFFPYAVAKDSLMACVVLLSIILMSLTFGAELAAGGAADAGPGSGFATESCLHPLSKASSSGERTGPSSTRGTRRGRGCTGARTTSPKTSALP